MSHEDRSAYGPCLTIGRNDNVRLHDVVQRVLIPEPWAEGEKIPWDEPGFSRRMLDEHLSQDHDLASRRSATIARHVAWIHDAILGGNSSRLLDLGCGPGLYMSRLASLGHECVGIDFGPAAIEYATATARETGLHCTYQLGDVRTAQYGSGFDLVMMIFGELNVFRPSDAAIILRQAHQALRQGGNLLLEVHTMDAVRAMGSSPRGWNAVERGLFSDRPHVRLDESFWDEDRRVATERYFVIDVETAAVARFAQSVQAYTDDEYHSLLADNGFDFQSMSQMDGTPTEPLTDLFAIHAVAR